MMRSCSLAWTPGRSTTTALTDSPPPLVGYADHGDICDRGVFGEDTFNLYE
jgi:hypothetical protein